MAMHTAWRIICVPLSEAPKDRHPRRRTPGEYAIERGGLTPVNRQPVGSAHGHDGLREPALIRVRLPLGSILRAFWVLVHARTRQREIQQVA